MSSDTANASGLDRIIKLWISLWSLVLENKRHYESICAVLQRLVFEKTGWPKFKNWPVICELGKTEPLMQRIIQDLDLSVVGERNARIIAAFGDCFSTIEVSGIPLSVIREWLIQERIVSDGDCTKEAAEESRTFINNNNCFTVFYGMPSHFGFPVVFIFDRDVDMNDCEVDEFGDAPRYHRPESISQDVKQWSTVVFDNRLYVVIENSSNGYGDDDRITLVPAEFIALDL